MGRAPLRGARPVGAALAVVAALAALAAPVAGCGNARPGPPLGVATQDGLASSHGSHVVVMVMENAEYSEVVGGGSAPYVDSLARRYGVARNSYAITHPSLPNYLALTSGSTQGIESDCTGCAVRAANIVDQLEAAHLSWRAYLEDVPGPCFKGAQAGGYAKKHNPFIYYQDVARSPARCARLVGFGRLAADLRAGSLPRFAWITPNLCDDGHDCGVRAADRFLARTVPLLLSRLGPQGVLVLTWDEGSSDAGCCGAAHGGRVATIVAGPGVRAGARESQPLDHYGVLATIEQALGLRALGGAADPAAGSLRPLFSRPPRVR